ncbi:surface antigen D15 domain-containing protein [Calothrix parasitica NIES-267]|uniref:Surface antigen D15 domain-containing protein n=1 Tax=Calothrix parasitica NIES-267 TaxID=1973488 RepID=A0A1Z4LK16_9CYAN|nr:surface antigen D15 domain-containing protein [Calothrix parasitica NIES-267]
MQLVKRTIIVITSIIINITFAYKANSQSTPPEGINIPPDIPEPVEETIPEREQQPIITPTPIPPPKLQIPETPQRTEPATPSNLRFNIKKIEVLGNTVLEDEINQLVDKYQNQNLSFADLIQLRTEITQLYIDNNYQTSGAFVVNNQLLNNGIAQIQVVEGQLESIEVSGLQRLKPSYVRSRLQAASKSPLNRERLESALQLLQIDPLLQQVNAELTAGSAPGKNILQVVVKEAPAFHSGVAVANNQSPSIGSVQGNVFVRHDNLLGFGDSLSAEYGLTDGLDIYSIGYSLPVNYRNATVNLRYSNNNSEIIEDTFEDLDIRSDSETFSLSFRQPLVRKPDTEFALSVGFDLRRSQTFIAKLRGNLEQASQLIREAFENEQAAAKLIAHQLDAEPNRSILHRSAATLAIDCGELKAAERLIAKALSGNPPEEIEEELKDLFIQINLRQKNC